VPEHVAENKERTCGVSVLCLCGLYCFWYLCTLLWFF